MVDTRDSQSDQAGARMRLVHRSSVGILALALAATGLVVAAGGTSAGRGSIPRSSAVAAVISKAPVVTGLSHQTNALVKATERDTTAAVATAPVATPVSTTSTTTPLLPAPAPAPAPAPSVPTTVPPPAPIAPAAPPAVSPTTESLVATLVAQVTASGIDPGSNWSWSMG